MSAFNTTPKSFSMMGRQFNFEFIPSIHFQTLLTHVLEAMTVSELNLLSDINDSALRAVSKVLKEQIYEIIRDVLRFQNQHSVDVATLQNTSRPLELANFLVLLMEDQEVKDALEVILKGLGKLTERMQTTPSATTNSTPSPSANSDSNPPTSSENSPAPSSED
jgi:restriction endonuclease